VLAVATGAEKRGLLGVRDEKNGARDSVV